MDGAPHDGTDQAAHDREVREALEDRGYRVIAIRYDRPIAEQVERYPDVFSPA